MIETHPFPDFVPEGMQYLIIGSFVAKNAPIDPRYDWYYSSKRNQFWRILELVYNRPLPDKPANVELFTSLKMGVTDVIYSCRRESGNSLDANLKDIVYNPNLESIIRQYPTLTVIFSSRFVEKHFRKGFKHLIADLPGLQMITLPSPSPRYAKLRLEQKVEIYSQLLPKLT